MSKSQYTDPRPSMPAATIRTIQVEAGHCCAVKTCPEHTYLEIHHIDFNRENNDQSNLILLCDKHHKMAHSKLIDRKALKEYKKLLEASHDQAIHERLARLEAMVSQDSNLKKGVSVTNSNETNTSVSGLKRESPERGEILNFVLQHVAIRHFEKEVEVPFEHQVAYTRGEDTLMLHALRQDDRMEHDFIIEVVYLRKSYTDAPVYGKWLESKVDLYELFTGRKARGILIVVVGRDRMKNEGGLPLTRQGIKECSRQIELEVFTCTEIGFHPGPISLAMVQSFLDEPDELGRNNTRSLSLSEDTVKAALLQRYVD